MTIRKTGGGEELTYELDVDYSDREPGGYRGPVRADLAFVRDQLERERDRTTEPLARLRVEMLLDGLRCLSVLTALPPDHPLRMREEKPPCQGQPSPYSSS